MRKLLQQTYHLDKFRFKAYYLHNVHCGLDVIMKFKLSDFKKKDIDDPMFGIYRETINENDGYNLQLGDRKSKKPWHEQFFADKNFEGKDNSLTACQEQRDVFLNKEAYKRYYSDDKPKVQIRSTYSNNTTGITGVTYGTVLSSNTYLFKAQYGQKLLGTFSAKKHSLEGAFMAAAKLRLEHDNKKIDEEQLTRLFKKWLRGQVKRFKEIGVPIYLSELKSVPKSKSMAQLSAKLNNYVTGISNTAIKAKRSRSAESLMAKFVIYTDNADTISIDINDKGFLKAVAQTIKKAESTKENPISEKDIKLRASKWCNEHQEIIEQSGIDL